MDLINNSFAAVRIVFYLTVPLIAASVASKSLDEDRPNFLIIMVDDISPNAFSCYGNTDYQTPNVDALAEEGVFLIWLGRHRCAPRRVLC